MAYGELEAEDQELNPDEGDRYLPITVRETRAAYRTTVDFAETMKSGELRERLEVALHGKGAFRRFKDVLLGYPRERERRFEFEQARLREAIEEWAEEEGIEVEFDSRTP